MNEVMSPMWLGEVGIWSGILLSLAIFSLLIRDNGAARLAQHILVGAGMGYVAVLLARDLFWQQVLLALWRNRTPTPATWIMLALLILISGAAVGRTLAGRRSAAGSMGRWTLIGLLPVALSAGYAAALVAVGVVQGTLAPQLLQAAATGLRGDVPPLETLTGVIMLAATSGALIHVRTRPARDWARAPGPVRSLIGAWAGIGKRALWLAAGVILARLIVSRGSMTGAQIAWLLDALYATRFWSWLTGIM